MKKKFIYRSLGLFLAAVMAVTTLPADTVAARAGQTETTHPLSQETNTAITTSGNIIPEKTILEKTIPENIISENAFPENTVSQNTVESETAEKTYNLDYLMTMDWENMEDTQVDEALSCADITDVGFFLNSLTEEDLDKLKTRAFMRGKKIVVQNYVKDSDIEEEFRLGETGEYDFIEYCLGKYRQSFSKARSTEFARKKGAFVFGLYRDGSDDRYTFTQANITLSSTSYANAQTLTVEYTGNAGCLTLGNTLKTSASNAGNYVLLKTDYTYQHGGMKGYRIKNIATPDVINSATRITHTGHDGSTDYISGNLTINLAFDANIGTTSTDSSDIHKQEFKFNFYKNSYTVAYNGNGSTGGYIEQQTIAYGDSTQTVKTNGFTRAYTVTYNGNGGTPAVGSQTAVYTFKGWGKDTTARVTTSVGTQISNWADVHGKVITLYAIWTPSSVRLPAATRTGYQFNGWSVGAADTAYTPSGNVTTVAKWKANTYKIALNANGGSPCSAISASYDENVTLPTPTRAGYTFNGWIGEGGTYKGVVKNLTATNGATVNLTAGWTADTETRYTIRRWRQPAESVTDPAKYELFNDNEKYGVKGTEILYGTTDSMIHIPAATVEGYVTPDAQTVVIKGDGSTVVNFYYQLKPPVTPDSGMNQSQIDEIAKRLAAGLSFSLDVNGATYEVMQNEDGTLGIKFSSTNESKVTIPDMVTIGNKVYRITEIYEEAFKGNTTLKEVELSANISEIGNSAFEGCSSLKKVTLHEGVAKIGTKAFYNCTALTGIKTPSTLQTIGNYAFMNCKNLKKVTLNNGLITIGGKAFYNCQSLTKMKFPKSLLKIGNYGFGKCTKLKTATFASGSLLLSLGTGAFYQCGTLSKITLPSKLSSIPAKAFYNCKKLKSVYIGKSVTKVGTNAFQNCYKLSKVKGGAGITTIGTYAFRNCKALTGITLQSKLQTIGKAAFYNCVKLKKVTIKSKALTAVGTKAFKKCKKGIKFAIPKAKKSAYQKLFKGKY